MILIVGSGGNGQTSFMKYLIKKKFNINNKYDEDLLKHAYSPLYPKIRKLIKNNKITKCIFLYNDPFNSVCSHFRRRWQIEQINKLGNFYKLKRNHLLNINLYLSLVDKYKKDLYSIEYQFNNWYNASQNPKKYGINFPILFVNFSNINKKELSLFLNCKDNYINIPVIKNRGDKYKNLKKRWPNANITYNDLYDKIKNKAINHNKKLIESVQSVII